MSITPLIPTHLEAARSADDAADTLIGIDVGGTKTDVVLVRGGTAVDRLTAPTGYGADAVLATATRLAEEIMVRQSARPAVAGLGVGIPGAVDGEGVVRNAVNLGIDELPLRELLQTRFARPVVVENDVNATALGLHRQLGLDPDASLGYVNLGTGLAAGLVLHGRLWRGASGGAGEIGHIPLWNETARCVCGQEGCVELFTSGGGLRRRHGAGALPPVAAEEAARAAAHVLLSLTLTLDVDVLALGGGLLSHTPGLLDRIADAVHAAGEHSSLVRSYDITRRMVAAPDHLPIAALGAALLVGATT